MIGFFVALILLAVAVLAMVMQKTYFYLPPHELKRQAEHHDPLAGVLWQAVGYGAALRVLLWLATLIFASLGLVLLVDIVPTQLAVLAVGLLLLVTFVWVPNTQLSSLGGRLTVWATPVVAWVLHRLAPALDWLHRQALRYRVGAHTGLFQREDLQALLEAQRQQPDNRIGEDELELARAALGFGHKYVRDILIPRSKVKAVSAADDLGPVMLDDLHKSGHQRFPVYEGKRDHLVGILYLHDLVERGSRRHHTVADVMVPDVYYMHEADNLSEALHTFYQTKHQLFVVVNGFNEYVGIVTLEDVLAELMGDAVLEPVQEPESREAVAARHDRVPETAEATEAAETVETTEADGAEPQPANTELADETVPAGEVDSAASEEVVE